MLSYHFWLSKFFKWLKFFRDQIWEVHKDEDGIFHDVRTPKSEENFCELCDDVEEIMSKVKFVDHQMSFGFTSLKMVESSVEAYLQVLVFMAIYLRESYGGVLTKEVLQSSKESKEFSSKLVFFYATTALSYIFICTGISAFIAEKQKYSM